MFLALGITRDTYFHRTVQRCKILSQKWISIHRVTEINLFNQESLATGVSKKFKCICWVPLTHPQGQNMYAYK